MLPTHEAVLAQLNQSYYADQAQLFVLYGHRRVGKTELLRAFVADKPHCFFIATLSSDADQLAAFSQQIWRHLHGQEVADFTFPSWEAAFAALAVLPNRPVVILNEITYLLDGNRSLLSTLQQVWDAQLQAAKLFLLLSGSYVATIERELLAEHTPLHGRYTGIVHLHPLPLPATARYFPNYSPVQQLETWAVLGGMPYYLPVFRDQLSVFENIQQQILHRRGALYSEPQLLLLEELHDPRNYFSILRAIAADQHKLSEISQAAGVGNNSTTGKYLDVLRQLGLVQREVTVTDRRPDKNRKGLYRITDAFLRFWFRFVHPNLRTLSLDLDEEILMQRVKPQFDHFVAAAFVDAAHHHLALMAQAGQLPFRPERIGRWWQERTAVPVVALNEAEQALLVGECNWRDQAADLPLLNRLRHKTALLNRHREWQRITYALFSKAGFTPEVMAIAAVEGIILVPLEAMINVPDNA